MFIREKIIYNQPYAYLVKTRWDKRSKKVKQKVCKYLGKINRLERIKNISYSEYFGIDNYESHLSKISLKDLVRNLIELEFYRHGFIRRTKHKMYNGENIVDLEKLEKVFAMNEGFMNKYTYREIFKYDKLLEEGTIDVPYKFAALFVNAGIDIDKDLFIELYRKLFSDNL